MSFFACIYWTRPLRICRCPSRTAFAAARSVQQYCHCQARLGSDWMPLLVSLDFLRGTKNGSRWSCTEFSLRPVWGHEAPVYLQLQANQSFHRAGREHAWAASEQPVCLRASHKWIPSALRRQFLVFGSNALKYVKVCKIRLANIAKRSSATERVCRGASPLPAIAAL